MVDAVDVDAEEWVRENAGAGWVRQGAVDDVCCKSTQQRVPTPSTTAAVCVDWPDDTIAIIVPVALYLDISHLLTKAAGRLKERRTACCCMTVISLCFSAQSSSVVPSGLAIVAATLVLATPGLK